MHGVHSLFDSSHLHQSSGSHLQGPQAPRQRVLPVHKFGLLWGHKYPNSNWQPHWTTLVGYDPCWSCRPLSHRLQLWGLLLPAHRHLMELYQAILHSKKVIVDWMIEVNLNNWLHYVRWKWWQYYIPSNIWCLFLGGVIPSSKDQATLRKGGCRGGTRKGRWRPWRCLWCTWSHLFCPGHPTQLWPPGMYIS